MIRVAYKIEIVSTENANGDIFVEHPIISKVDVTDLEAVDWRTAKKQLRAFYLNKAAALRKVSEETYFDDTNV